MAASGEDTVYSAVVKEIEARSSGSPHYYMPKAMPLVLCGACLMVPLEQLAEAIHIFRECRADGWVAIPEAKLKALA